MIQCQVKLKLTPRQERQLTRWFRHLTAVWNWSIKKIENDAHVGIYYRPKGFVNLLAGHGQKIGVPSHVIQCVLSVAYTSWTRCFKGLAKKPRLKGRRRRLNSIPFSDPFRAPGNGRIHILGLGKVRFHKQSLPIGKIKCGRVVKRASGWYLCLFIDAAPESIPVVGNMRVGIDPGFKSLITLSDGEKVERPRELEGDAQRLVQSQRGHNGRLTARLKEHEANQRKDRNHKLSRRLVAENQFIAFSADRHKAIAKRFGKSVASSGHDQLRQMLSYKSKCRTDGLGVYVEVDSRNSTKTCSPCGALTGPSGLAGLRVRQWTCAHCGAEHDRDVNAAINTLVAGVGLTHERLVRVA
jgi:transposase